MNCKSCSDSDLKKVEIFKETGKKLKVSNDIVFLGDKILNCKVYYTIASLATAEEITSEPVEFSLLPESSKKIEYVLDKPLAKGRYSVTAILDYGFSDNLEGVELEIEVK